MAIYTAECSHAFHFPCIAAHVRKQGTLICPVCNVTWKDVPHLSFHKNQHHSDEIIEKTTSTSTATATTSAPTKPTGTNRIHSIKTKVCSDKSCYNDDEPLLSPPIPEVEEFEHSEEFQGFFPTPRKPAYPYGSIEYTKNVEVKLLPEAAVVVSTNRSYETYVVALRVTAAAILSPNHRAPVDLVTVLDMSGSMIGAKLQMLKRAMRLVISSLGPADRLSIVAFSYSSQRLLPLKRMNIQGKESARRVIDRLACCQGSCLSEEALRKAAKVLQDRRDKNSVASIMLLSDGQDDRIVNEHTSSSNSTRFAHIEIPIHSSKDAFAKCVASLLSVVVQDLRIQLGFAPGSAPPEIIAVYSCTSRPTLMNCDSAQLGDLYAEEERQLLIELKVPTSALGSHHVMSVRCSYKDPISQELMIGRERGLLVPRLRPRTVQLSHPRLRNLFVYTRAVAESNRLVDHNDFTSAHHLLSSARALVLQSSAGSASTDEYVQGLEAELAQVHWRRNYHLQVQKDKDHLIAAQPLLDENGDPLTPTSAWRAAERLAKVAIMKKSLNRSFCDLYGFENARF